MPTTLRTAAEGYLRAKALARDEYLSTLRKWEQWGAGGPVEQLSRKESREFLDCVHERLYRLRHSSSGEVRNALRAEG